MNETIKSTFENLVNVPSILEALTNLGFTEATQVQSLTILPALDNKDLVVEAKTGSGKTLAFGVPMLCQLQTEIDKGPVTQPFGLVVTPTRELAVQIATVLGQIIPDLAPVTLIGGIPYPKQKRQLTEDPRIVVGTPGRILDAIDQGDLDLRNLKMFVLDEADEMFSIGFTEDVEQILSAIPEKSQGLFVSATISPRVLALANKFLHEPEHVSAATLDETPPDIRHVFCEVGEEVVDKPIALCDFLEAFQPESAIIFCNTKSETELVEEFMRRRGFDARRMNSDLTQVQRNKIMEKIRARELRYLIATDIAARGIDIAQIELVVNFSIHHQSESYVHRTGRTGRAGRKGTALSLVGPHDFMGFQAVKALGIPLEKIMQPTDQEVASAQILHLNESLKTTRAKLRPRDLVLGKEIMKLIQENTENSLEPTELLATIARYTLEHLVDLKALSLEEELGKEANRNSPQQNFRPNDRQQNNRRQQRR